MAMTSSHPAGTGPTATPPETQHPESPAAEEVDELDLEIDPALAASMGFTSFGFQPRPKKRKPNPGSTSPNSASNPSHNKQKQKHSHATGANATATASTRQGQPLSPPGLSSLQQPSLSLPPKPYPSHPPPTTGIIAGGRKSTGNSAFGGTNPSRLIEAFHPPMHDLPPRPPPSESQTGCKPSGGADTGTLNLDAGEPHYEEDDSGGEANVSTHKPWHPVRNTKTDDGSSSTLPTEGGGAGGENQDWRALRRGIRNERGDMAYYDRSFVEDPWRDLREGV